MSKNTKKLLSVATAFLLISASNAYAVKNGTIIRFNSRLATEDYLLEDSSLNFDLKQKPKIKSRK